MRSSPFRNRFGIPGVISVIALVFAMIGGAYAANDSGGDDATASARQKSKAASGKQGPRGPRGKPGKAGAPGAPGATGPAGPTGLAGSAGQQGPKGDPGNNGSPGADGKSVETGDATPIECSSGGATVQVVGEPATKKAVCNGETGFVPNLPEDETVTGAFAMRWSAAGLNTTAVSFPLPLTSDLAASNVHAVNPAGEEFNPSLPGFEPPENCLGSTAAPTAPAGHLCVYVGSASGTSEPVPGLNFNVPFIQKTTASGFGIDVGANTSGAVFWFQAAGPGGASGTFAVTGAIEG